MTTGQLIKDARKKSGMTQAELAQKLGISYVGVSQWENDLRNPKYATLQRIAVALGVPVQQLIPEHPSAAFDFQDAAIEELRKKLPNGYDIATGDDIESPLQIIYPDGKLSKEVSQGDLWAIVQNATGYLCYELDKLR